MVEAWCMKCKSKREMNNAKKVTMKNGRPAMSGVCSECGTKMFKIGDGSPSKSSKKSKNGGASKKSKRSKRSKRSKKSKKGGASKKSRRSRKSKKRAY
jgi:hypothetical protein